MTEEQKNNINQILAEHERKRRRIEPVKRNQLSLWLGRLIIAYNSLENSLATFLTMELVELIGKDEPPKNPPLTYLSPSLQRAWNAGLNDIVMATIPFKQKLDFFTAILFKKFQKDAEQQEHIKLIARLMYAADEFRNRMIHSVWQVNHSDVSRIKAKTKGRTGLKIEREDADIKQIHDACDVILCLEKICLFTMARRSDENLRNLDYEKIAKILRPTANLKPYRTF